MIRSLHATLARWRAREHWNAVRDLPIHRQYDRLQAIFIHIPKTAGLSVSHALFDGEESQHRDAFQMRLIFGNRDFRRFFKFTFVRDPLDRFFSAYYFLREGGISELDREFAVQSGIRDAPPSAFLDRLLRDPSIRNYLHFAPQWPYAFTPAGRQEVDFLGHFESLQADFQTVAKGLGLDVELPRKNTGRGRPYNPDHDFSPEDKEKVRVLYRKDYALLQY